MVCLVQLYSPPVPVLLFQAAHTSKNLSVAGRRVQLNLWDTAGQERYHALGPIYYRDRCGGGGEAMGGENLHLCTLMCFALVQWYIPPCALCVNVS